MAAPPFLIIHHGCRTASFGDDLVRILIFVKDTNHPPFDATYDTYAQKRNIKRPHSDGKELNPKKETLEAFLIQKETQKGALY
jgi:hypothetical protein